MREVVGVPNPRAIYDRNAVACDLLEVPMELLFFRRWRRLFAQVPEGHVLEVGVGTGKDLPFYRPQTELVAIDFSRRMLQKARTRAARIERHVRLELMDAENLRFPDDTFDSATAAFVLCATPDPLRGLLELRRVLKPGGKLYMLERVRPSFHWGGFASDLMNPLAVRFSGANINRRTVDTVRNAGFRIERDVNLLGSVFREVIAVARPCTGEAELVGAAQAVYARPEYMGASCTGRVPSTSCSHEKAEAVPALSDQSRGMPGSRFGMPRRILRAVRWLKSRHAARPSA